MTHCKLHPKYKGAYKPKVSCYGCWWLYFFGDYTQGRTRTSRVAEAYYDYIEG